MSPEDHAMLLALDQAGRGDAADSMEALIRSQCDLPAERDHTAHEVPESDLGNGAVTAEFIASERAARARFGTGGGRQRRPDPAGPSV